MNNTANARAAAMGQAVDRLTAHCTAQNGTYCCQLLPGHAGVHQSTFRSVGVLKLARWADAYGPIRITRKS